MYEHTYGKYFNFNVRAIGVFLVVFAFYLSYYVSYFGLLLIIPAIFIFATNHGVEILFNEKKYRFFTEIFGSKFGTWHALSQIDYISIFSVNMPQRLSNIFPDTIISTDSEIQVNLICENRENITAFTTKNYSVALIEAERLSSLSHVEYKDFLKRD